MEVKADRGSTTGAMPELVVGEPLHRRLDVFPHLLQGVSGRLEIGLDTGDRAAEPDFGNRFHG